MADYTNNLNLILPGDDDYALVENLTDDFQAIDDFAGDVVKVYDPTTTHSKREYCIYQDHLYKCNSFITQPEAFDPSKWDRVILGDEVRNNNSYITNLQSGLAIVQDGDTATKAITQGQYVLWKSSMRYAKANIAIGETLSSTNLGSVTYDNGALNRLNEQIGSLDLTLQAKRVLATAKTIHEINVPNDTLHFLIFGATSYGLHGYGMVATTSGGAVDAETMQLEGITITTTTGKVVCDLGSTARPFYLMDILIRGNGFCTLS